MRGLPVQALHTVRGRAQPRAPVSTAPTALSSRLTRAQDARGLCRPQGSVQVTGCLHREIETSLTFLLGRGKYLLLLFLTPGFE